MLKNFIFPLCQDIKLFILNMLFPITCITCSADGLLICADCKSSLKKLKNQLCIVCQKQAIFGLTHPNCLTPYRADGLISFYDYHDENIAKILIAGKYKFIPDVFKILGQMLANNLSNFNDYKLPTTNYQLVPVPLHSTRLRWRGFNQSEILVKQICKYSHIPNINALVRPKLTKTQKDLNKQERQKNLVDAFKLAPNANVKNKNIILVDDVTTTGSTLSQATKVLKQNGAKSVICLTVARD
jgi:ComF family protein